MHDRGMSLHRRALGCRSEAEWEELAPRIGLTDPSTISQIWRTARSAHRAGMPQEKAFPLRFDIDRMAESVVEAYLLEVQVGPGVYNFTNKETNQWHMVNHPHNKPPGRHCRKCGSPRVMMPSYNTDFFDCLDCGRSWPQTAKQMQFMRTHPASMYDESKSGLGETVFTNERVLNYVLTNAGSIIGRRDISALDKFETLFAYVLKARREVLGEVDV